MHNNQPSRGTSPSDSSKWLLACRIARHCWIVCTLANTHAASIYRCGSTYSTNNICTESPAIEITPHAVPSPPSRHQVSTAAWELREAEALQRDRMTLENKALKQALPNIIMAPSRANVGGTDTLPASQPHPFATRRRTPNLYFTAKDPHEPPKKKGNAQALPASEK